MYETLKHVLEVPHPLAVPDSPATSHRNPDSNLNDIVAQLKEENRINRAVQKRLDIPPATPEDPVYDAFIESADSSPLEAE
jgi:hypothetical protein